MGEAEEEKANNLKASVSSTSRPHGSNTDDDNTPRDDDNSNSSGWCIGGMVPKISMSG